jgi:hypothetical protein
LALRPNRALRCFQWDGGNSVPYGPLISIAPAEPPRSSLDLDRGYYGEAPGWPAGWSGAGLEEQAARGSTVWGAKLGSDGSPRRGRPVKGQSRGTAWRVILQASPVTLPSERAMNRGLACDDAGHGAGHRYRSSSPPKPTSASQLSAFQLFDVAPHTALAQAQTSHSAP